MRGRRSGLHCLVSPRNHVNAGDVQTLPFARDPSASLCPGSISSVPGPEGERV